MRLKIYSFGILLVTWFGTGFYLRNAQSLATNNDSAFTCTGLEGVKFLYANQSAVKNLISSASHALPYGQVFTPTLCCSAIIEALRGWGWSRGLLFWFQSPVHQTVSKLLSPQCLWTTLLCESDWNKPPKALSFILPPPHTLALGPSGLGWTLGLFMHCSTLPDLQADKTCQTKHRKDNQRAYTAGFNFAPTFSGEKQVCFSILRLLKLPERQIANKHPLTTSTGLYVVVCHLFLRLVLIFSLSSFDS